MNQNQVGAGRLTFRLLACVLLLTAGACQRGNDQQRYTVTRADKAVTIQASGTLVSKNSAYLVVPKIPSVWSYRLEFLAPEGSTVKQGDPVIRFDHSDISQRIRSLKQNLDSKEKDLAGYQLRTVERTRKLALSVAEQRAAAAKLKSKLLVPDHLVERAELEKDRLRAKKAALTLARLETEQKNLAAEVKEVVGKYQSSIERVEQEIALQQQHIEELEVKAPRAGMVVHKRNRRGERRRVGDECYAGATLAEIPDLEGMAVAAVIDEHDAGRVALDQTVIVRLDAYPDREFTAKVNELGHIFRTKAYDKPSIVFDAGVTLLQTDPELMRPGMAATLAFEVERHKAVLFVPRDCIRFRDGQAYVEQPGRWRGTRQVPVQLGRRGEDWVEIVTGIEAGAILLRRDSRQGEGPA